MRPISATLCHRKFKSEVTDTSLVYQGGVKLISESHGTPKRPNNRKFRSKEVPFVKHRFISILVVYANPRPTSLPPLDGLPSPPPPQRQPQPSAPQPACRTALRYSSGANFVAANTDNEAGAISRSSGADTKRRYMSGLHSIPAKFPSVFSTQNFL
jgi:hypothetical protein